MAIYKESISGENFSILSNAMLRDTRLTFKARGLLAYMLSHAGRWNMTVKSVATINGVGQDQVRSALSELEALGYARRERARNDDGTLGGVDWFISDAPTPGFPALDKPTQDNTDLKKINIKKTKTKEAQALSAPVGDALFAGENMQDVQAGKKPEYTAEFEEIWELYGNSRNKKQAFNAYRSARKKHSHGDLMGFVRRFHAGRRREQKAGVFVATLPYFATFLNGERWEDYPEYATNAAVAGSVAVSGVESSDYPPGAKKALTPQFTALELDQILGKDNWTPTEPADGFATLEDEMTWRKQQIAQRRAYREEEARKKLGYAQ